MKADEFVKAVTDPSEWLKRSNNLRESANVLWDAVAQATADYSVARRGQRPDMGEKLNRAVGLIASAQMLYGLSVETAMKGLVLKLDPSKIELTIVANGRGEAQKASVKEFGVPIRGGHNLISLANELGVLRRGEGALYQEESDFQMLHAILGHLGDMVQWGARYPTPTHSDGVTEWPEDLPSSGYSIRIRDWLDPLLDHLYSRLHGA